MPNERRLQPDSHAEPLPEFADGESLDVLAEDASSAESLDADAALAKRCQAGEVAAWAELYANCHDPLLASIKILLGSHNGDLDLVDELAARVWYLLVADDGALLGKYNPKHGARLATFMRALAKDEIRRHFRAERRRRKREMGVARHKAKYQSAEASQSDASLSEFLVTLTPGEKGFADDYLLAAAGAEPVPGPRRGLSLSTIWQVTGRIRRKLLSFLRK